MLLCVDIGNSNITLGVYEQENLKFVARLATDRLKTGDQYAVELRNIFHIYDISTKDITGSCLASVVPSVGRALRTAVELVTDKKPLVVGPGVKSGLNIKIDNPAQLGADLVAGGVAAIAMYQLPCIIFDLGTATTISVIDKNANYLGGSISAGVGISHEALTNRTSLLQSVEMDTPKSVIGSNTIDCIQSGLIYGCASMLDGMAERIEEKLGEKATLVATGGLAPEIIKNCKRKIEYCDNLLLEGLRIIYNKNK